VNRAAYLLINCEHGFKEEVIKKLQQLPEIVEGYQTVSAYDLIAKDSADLVDKLRETITLCIRRIDKIRSTLILTSIEGQS
jgi:DNA-binding Lrp family transcriptional regulator